MATLGTTTTTRDNLVTAQLPLRTAKVYPVKAGISVVRGEALKLVAGKLEKLALVTDVPYTVVLQDSNSASDAYVDYVTNGSLLGSELTFAVGAIADYREDFLANTQILIEG